MKFAFIKNCINMCKYLYVSHMLCTPLTWYSDDQLKKCRKRSAHWHSMQLCEDNYALIYLVSSICIHFCLSKLSWRKIIFPAMWGQHFCQSNFGLVGQIQPVSFLFRLNNLSHLTLSWNLSFGPDDMDQDFPRIVSPTQYKMRKFWIGFESQF